MYRGSTNLHARTVRSPAGIRAGAPANLEQRAYDGSRNGENAGQARRARTADHLCEHRLCLIVRGVCECHTGRSVFLNDPIEKLQTKPSSCVLKVPTVSLAFGANVLFHRYKFKVMVSSNFHKCFVLVGLRSTQRVVEVRHNQRDSELALQCIEQTQQRNRIRSARNANSDAASGRQRSGFPDRFEYELFKGRSHRRSAGPWVWVWWLCRMVSQEGKGSSGAGTKLQAVGYMLREQIAAMRNPAIEARPRMRTALRSASNQVAKSGATDTPHGPKPRESRSMRPQPGCRSDRPSAPGGADELQQPTSHRPSPTRRRCPSLPAAAARAPHAAGRHDRRSTTPQTVAMPRSRKTDNDRHHQASPTAATESAEHLRDSKER